MFCVIDIDPLSRPMISGSGTRLLQVRAGRIRRKPSEIPPEEEEKQDLRMQGMLTFLRQDIWGFPKFSRIPPFLDVFFERIWRIPLKFGRLGGTPIYGHLHIMKSKLRGLEPQLKSENG